MDVKLIKIDVIAVVYFYLFSIALAGIVLKTCLKQLLKNLSIDEEFYKMGIIVVSF